MSSKFLQLATLLALATILGALSCSSNQYYVGDQYCVNCPSNCSTCSNADFCTSCQPNYFLVKGNFNATCQTCSQIFVGCATCLSNVACTKCVEGYFVKDFGCSLCSSRTLFCISCSADGNTCNQCAYPFILVKNLCVSATVNDVIGKPPTTPISDSTGSTTNTTTTNTADLVTLANGTKVPAVKDVYGCNQVQIYVYGQCFKSIPNCNLYQASGLCQYCSKGFLVTIFGDCAPSNRWLACETGFWLNSAIDQCVKVSPACDWYYPDTGACYNCSKGYTWSNNTCVQNLECNSRQFFFAGTCITVPPECTTFSPVDGACLSCAVGYQLKGGLCSFQQAAAIINNGCKFPCNTCFQSAPDYCYSCVIYY